ncbi:MAG TPA: CPBP family intramembrane metalloprotease [Ligilactobacillus acidipiscis]|uniref:CPBP family intramembrane metalloprotease n=1 Tax=Ligilactobacillus acidipiscis TaxID=89059 RepID=A0A921FBM3_9LACO|nr:CPBP family intramembrane metalloprotease [Ligilactobacillus acidipiscis]
MNKNKTISLTAITIFYIWLSTWAADLFSKVLSNHSTSLVMLLSQFIVVILMLILIRKSLLKSIQQIKKHKKFLFLPIVTVIFNLLFQILYQSLINVPESANQSENLHNLTQSPWEISILFVVVTVVTGPIAEEIIFQYLIQENLFRLCKPINKHLAEIISIIVATLLFMGFHFLNESNFSWLAFFGYGYLIFSAIVYSFSRHNLSVAHILFSLIALISII